jgi:hypothetical protein
LLRFPSTDTDFDIAQGTCVAPTQVDGNVVGGTSLLEGTGPTPYNADAETLRTYLTASATVGDVNVTREGPNGQQGCTYLITFIADEGDVSALTAVSSLTGTAANIKVDEVTQGTLVELSRNLGWHLWARLNGHLFRRECPL